MFWNSGKLPDSSVLSELGEHLMDSSHQIAWFSLRACVRFVV